MKIKIKNADGKEIVLDTTVTATSPMYGGGQYYRITYSINGDTVYECAGGCTHTPPSAIAALAWEREVRDDTIDVHKWECNGKTNKGDYVKRTNRELLIQALSQIVAE